MCGGEGNRGNEDSLVGLVREGEGIGGKGLYGVGLGGEKIEKEVEKLIGGGKDS